MIQRIQTIYFLLALASTIAMFFFPFYVSAEGIPFLLTSNIILTISLAVIALILLINIFLFKDRKKQLLLTKISLGLTFLFPILVLVLTFLELNNLTITPSLSSVLTLINLVLIFLGLKGIQKDEALVKSMDRWR